jgi:hypothetical protein
MALTHHPLIHVDRLFPADSDKKRGDKKEVKKR